MEKQIVYTEIQRSFEEGGSECWYYGTYDRATANRVAIELGNEYPTYHCVCKASEAEEFGIKNLPNR